MWVEFIYKIRGLLSPALSFSGTSPPPYFLLVVAPLHSAPWFFVPESLSVFYWSFRLPPTFRLTAKIMGNSSHPIPFLQVLTLLQSMPVLFTLQYLQVFFCLGQSVKLLLAGGASGWGLLYHTRNRIVS